MNKYLRCLLFSVFLVVILATQFIPSSAIAGGKWKQVSADETRIVLNGWPEADRLKYYKGWHTDDWSQECEQASNHQGVYKTMIQVCRVLPGFYYNPQHSGDDISKYGYWKWNAWKGSEITPGQDTEIEYEDPRIFRHVYFTQHGNKCQFMSHVNSAGGTKFSNEGGFRPIVVVMTCNTEGIFRESSFNIDDDNAKVVISYPGQSGQ